MSDKAPKAKAPEFTDPLALSGKPVPQSIPMESVFHDRKLQVRSDCDAGYDVDTHRTEQFAAALKSGAKFPPIKVIECDDAPGCKGEVVRVMFDGYHTFGAHEMNKAATINALVWKGKYAQALAAAATVANVEHANNGKPLSYKDKIRALHVYASALKAAGVPAKEWPSNRAAAAKFGVSHTAVGDEDPFERRREDSKTAEQKKAEKRAEREKAKAADAGPVNAPPAAPAAKRYEIVQKTTAQIVDTIEAGGAEKALAAFKEKKPHVELKEFVAREAPAPKNGSVKVQFDFAKMDSDIGSVVRGIDGMADVFGLKDAAVHKNAVKAAENLIAALSALREATKSKRVEK